MIKLSLTFLETRGKFSKTFEEDVSGSMVSTVTMLLYVDI